MPLRWQHKLTLSRQMFPAYHPPLNLLRRRPPQFSAINEGVSCAQVSRLAEQNAALQEEVRQLRAQKGSGSGSEELATLHAVNARLAEENAVLPSSNEDLEWRLAGEGGSSSGSGGPSREEVCLALLQMLHSACSPGLSMLSRDAEIVRGVGERHFPQAVSRDGCLQANDYPWQNF